MAAVDPVRELIDRKILERDKLQTQIDIVEAELRGLRDAHHAISQAAQVANLAALSDAGMHSDLPKKIKSR